MRSISPAYIGSLHYIIRCLMLRGFGIAVCPSLRHSNRLKWPYKVPSKTFTANTLGKSWNGASRDPRTAWSEDRSVRLRPRFSKFYWSWSGSVRDFPNWNRLKLEKNQCCCLLLYNRNIFLIFEVKFCKLKSNWTVITLDPSHSRGPS